MPAGKAPGPSGLTANMIKAWPEETIVVVHAMLSKMWKDKSIPPWWGDKLLCGIPKKPGESSLSNVVNAMEDARHSPEHTPLYCTFWDYKAAFDSIPRNLMRLAWARLVTLLGISKHTNALILSLLVLFGAYTGSHDLIPLTSSFSQSRITVSDIAESQTRPSSKSGEYSNAPLPWEDGKPPPPFSSYDAYQQGTGGIGIVWLPPEEELRMSPARILRIIPTPESSHLPHMTANTMELYAQVDDPPRWHDINPALAYAVCPKKPRTTAQIINATNRVYRKSHRYGNNRGKGLIGPAKDEAEKCPHCDAPETPSHIYAECRAPGLHALRVRLKDSQRRALATMTHNSIPQWQYRFFENLHLLSFETDDDYAEKFWNATLGRSDMMLCFEHATDATRDLTASQFQAFKKLFIEFVTPLTEGAIEVERLKFQLKYGKILPSLASALRSRVDKGSLPPTATLDPRHPIVQALAITITAGNRKRRIPADPDSPPKFLAT
eukprot:g20260.t1